MVEDLRTKVDELLKGKSYSLVRNNAKILIKYNFLIFFLISLHFKFLLLVAPVIVQTLSSASPSSGPLIASTLDVVSGKVYRVKIEILRTDTASSDEYATIELDGHNFGTCSPNGSDGDCTWYTCPSLIFNEITARDHIMQIRIKYSYEVSISNGVCNGVQAASARVTLTEK